VQIKVKGGDIAVYQKPT